METRKHKWKNIAFLLATILLWASARLLFVRLFNGSKQQSGSVAFDIYFIFLAPIIAFFLNWYWMRDERTDTLIKWAVSWAAIDLVLLFLAIHFGGDPLHKLFVQMQA